MNAPGLIFLIVLFFCQPVVPQAEFSGKCIGVIDGDTINVLRNGRSGRIRLEGIDCLERGQAFSAGAKQFTSGFLFGKTVTVKIKEPDRYGRLVASVIADGKDVPHELVKAGLAWHFKKYNKDPDLAKLEDQARKDRVGLWSIPNPVPPSELPSSTGPRAERHVRAGRRSRVRRQRRQPRVPLSQLPAIQLQERHERTSPT